jgi:hypothetical protein
LCITQLGFADKTTPEENNEIYSSPIIFPAPSFKISVDLELSFIYLQRNWDRLLKEMPVIFGPNLPPPLQPVKDPDSDPNFSDDSAEYCTEYFEPDCCSNLNRINSIITLRHIEPGGIGYCDGYSTIAAWLNFCYCVDKQKFVDLRLHYFNNNEWAGNIGVGSRSINQCTNSAYGFNVFFDLRTNCHSKHFFPQFGIGFERLSCCLDIRLNGYFPFSRTKSIKHCHFTYPGGFFIDRDKKQVALMGGDLEIGKCLFQRNCFQFYGALGTYAYGRYHCIKSFIGGRARAALCISRYFSLEGIATYDRRYKARYQGSVSINIPFGGCSDDNDCCFNQPIIRNEIIVLDTYCKWNTNF